MMALAQANTAVDVIETRDDMLNAYEVQAQKLGENQDYYDAVRRPKAIGLAVPPRMKDLLAHVGYSRSYVNALADRLELEGFRMPGKDEADADLQDWWKANFLDSESKLGHVEAFIHGRAYITISMPDPELDIGLDPEVPLIRIESPRSMYAEIDPRSRRVSKAIRALYNKEGTDVTYATLYLPDQTVLFEKIGGSWQPPQTVPHGLGVVPVVPLVNRSRLSDLYGTSEITPELKSLTDAASRIMMLMQAVAELMGVPQRLLFGIKESELGRDPLTGEIKFDAYLARILGFEDPDGKAQQFSAAELRNFVDALEEIHKQAASVTGLPPQYLSTQSENPASAEAIRASESRLVKTAETKALVFGSAWEEAMRIAWRMAKASEVPPAMYRMETIWADPATPTYAAKADAATKLYGNGTGVIPKERARIDMGYSVTEREQMRRWDEEEDSMGQLARLYGAPSPADAVQADASDAGAARPEAA